MLIQTEETPNANALKFIVLKSILDSHQTMDFNSQKQASISPLAEMIFELKGVKRVFFGHDFIVVTKEADYSWDSLRTTLSAIIMDFLLTNQPILYDALPEPLLEMDIAPEDQEIVHKIKTILDTEIRPSVARDGGDIIFYGYKAGYVYLKMQGSCQGCPSSAMTLKHGVEVILRRYLPEIVSVEQVMI